MTELERLYFESRETFRNWLEINHNENPGIWMIYYKKHTGKKCIEYSEALEEALCFGWIDSTLKRIDDDRYIRKFTPRTNTSNWSEVNRKLVLSLISNGRMTEAGLRKIDVWLKTGRLDWKTDSKKADIRPEEINVPDYFLKALSENEPALTNFNSLARSYKRQYVLWITSAKREETILKRMKESLELLKQNQILGLK
jgi:uncharacterized protein YdeI (YjbR/CyaY-like superfamily)